MNRFKDRPSLDTWGLKIASVIAVRSTCLRRAVGCVLMNERGQILSTGYNGRAAGLPNCNGSVSHRLDKSEYPNACEGAFAESGEDLDRCEAIHAEQNALLQCSDVTKIRTVYVTVSPCVTCTKLFLNTGARTIVFIERYADETAAKKLWEDAGRNWIRDFDGGITST